MTVQGQLLDPMFKNGVLVVGYQPAVIYILSTGMNYLLEQWIGESSMI